MFWEILFIILFFVALTLFTLERAKRKKLEQDRLDRLNNRLTESDMEVRQSKAGEHREARIQGVLKKKAEN
jgi:cbb3-type cytochrome oxidase subunit 3